MLILYATQTGTAEYLARTLNRLFESEIQDIQSYDYIHLPKEQRVLFIVSTTGDGDMPRSMNNFWQFLLIKDLPKNSLQNVEFSVFGLGDSSYSKFNYAGRKLRSRLLQLSAQEIIPSLFGDEMHPCGVETEFYNWVKSMNFQKRMGGDQCLTQIIKIKHQQSHFQAGNIQFKSSVQLTPQDHTKQTINYIFEDSKTHKPGDLLVIYPQNSKEIVDGVMELLQYDDDLIDITTSKTNIPKQLLVSELLTHYLDLTSPPDRYFVSIMSKYAKNEIHIEKLVEMSSQTPEGLEEYYRYVYREKRNVYEVLYDFQPCLIPLNEFIDSIKSIRPREYSISHKHLAITVAIVQYVTAKNRTITGFCSGFLKSLKPGQLIRGEIQQGTMSFNGPLILIGPGTGVAPFICHLDSIQEYKDIILFFGSCYESKEFYYKEIQQRVTLFTAFSRDQAQKIYVQHRIVEQAKLLSEFIRDHIFEVKIIVAGTSRKMPQQVENALKSILPNGEATIQELKKRKQYIVECW